MKKYVVVVEKIEMKELFEALCEAKNVDFMLRRGTETIYYVWCNEEVWNDFKEINCLPTLGEAD